jgi:phage shock protein PspC (stress-responsive transcriptional regulator)
LQRSRRDYIVAGVTGGLAEFFGISVFWFRLTFLIVLIPAVCSAWCFTCCSG